MKAGAILLVAIPAMLAVSACAPTVRDFGAKAQECSFGQETAVAGFRCLEDLTAMGFHIHGEDYPRAQWAPYWSEVRAIGRRFDRGDIDLAEMAMQFEEVPMPAGPALDWGDVR